MEKVAVQAKIETLSSQLKWSILKAIRKANRNNGKQVNLVDQESNVSYLFTVKREEEKVILMASVVDYIPVPNASVLPFLTSLFGEPTKSFAKPWIRDNRATFFIMFWENPIFENLHKENVVD